MRKETKAHGLQRRIEGPLLEPGERCLIVEDVVTTGGSTLQAIEAVREAGHEIVGVITVLDRLAGGAERDRRRRRARRTSALATIDDVYPERPDRGDRREPGVTPISRQLQRPEQDSNLRPTP